MKKTNLRDLLEKAKKHQMTDEEKEVQRESFAFGNTSFENPEITKESVHNVSHTKSNVAKNELFVSHEHPKPKRLPYPTIKQKKGRFIVLEGIDGSGTTTQSKLITNYLFDKSKENHIFLTREPTYSQFGLKARKLLKEGKDPKENVLNFLYLFTKDREEHYKNQIKPNLEKGIHVICDRYELSTFAYQSTQGADKEQIYNGHRKLGIDHPDIYFILDVDPKIAMSRMKTRNDQKEVFEVLPFQTVLRHSYTKASDKYPNVRIVDASRSIEYVTSEIVKELQNRFNL